jgi:hypothetical protein
MLTDSDYGIVSKYQSEYRGIVQYYLLAHNVGLFTKVHWVAETSRLENIGRETHVDGGRNGGEVQSDH